MAKQPIRLGGDFFVTVSYHVVDGKHDDYAVIESASIGQDDGLMPETPINLTTDAQRERIKELFIGATYYSEAFFSDEEAENYEEVAA